MWSRAASRCFEMHAQSRDQLGFALEYAEAHPQRLPLRLLTERRRGEPALPRRRGHRHGQPLPRHARRARACWWTAACSRATKALRLRNWEPFPVQPESLRRGRAHPRARRPLRATCRHSCGPAIAGPCSRRAAPQSSAGIVLPDSGRLQEEDASVREPAAATRSTSRRCRSTRRTTRSPRRVCIEPVEFGEELEVAPGVRRALRARGPHPRRRLARAGTRRRARATHRLQRGSRTHGPSAVALAGAGARGRLDAGRIHLRRSQARRCACDRRAGGGRERDRAARRRGGDPGLRRGPHRARAVPAARARGGGSHSAPARVRGQPDGARGAAASIGARSPRAGTRWSPRSAGATRCSTRASSPRSVIRASRTRSARRPGPSS